MSNDTTRSAQLEFHFAPLCQCGCGQPLKVSKNPRKQARYLPNHHQGHSKGTLEERFWAKVDKTGPNECWLWTAMRARGYGRFNYHGKMLPSPRVAWELTHGPIPDGLFVCHNCPGGDNPACVNPAHLFLGTPKDNSQDMVKKGRTNPASGEASGQAKLTEEAVVKIREMYASGRFTLKQMARKFGVSDAALYPVVTGRTWKRVGGPITIKKVNGVKVQSHKLTAEDVKEIRRRYAEGGILYRELAEEYNIGKSTVDSIIRRVSWKNI